MTRRGVRAPRGHRPAAYLICRDGGSLRGVSEALAEFRSLVGPEVEAAASAAVAGLACEVIDAARAGHPCPFRSYGGGPVLSWAIGEARSRFYAIYSTMIRDPEFDFEAAVSVRHSVLGPMAFVSFEQESYLGAWERVEGVASYPWWDGQGPDGVPRAEWIARRAVVVGALDAPALTYAHLGRMNMPDVSPASVARAAPRVEDRSRAMAQRRILADACAGAPKDRRDEAFWEAARRMRDDELGRREFGSLWRSIASRLSDLTVEELLADAPAQASRRAEG